jgi:hypothetical protein
MQLSLCRNSLIAAAIAAAGHRDDARVTRRWESLFAEVTECLRVRLRELAEELRCCEHDRCWNRRSRANNKRYRIYMEEKLAVHDG